MAHEEKNKEAMVSFLTCFQVSIIIYLYNSQRESSTQGLSTLESRYITLLEARITNLESQLESGRLRSGLSVKVCCTFISSIVHVRMLRKPSSRTPGLVAAILCFKLQVTMASHPAIVRLP